MKEYTLVYRRRQSRQPRVVWDLDWMDTFLNAVQQKGGHIDFSASIGTYLRWFFSAFYAQI